MIKSNISYKKTVCHPQSKIPGWHFPMLNDHQRNKAFYDALALNINENTIVLDIGAGGGLLSMIAAKLGAKHVFAVESNDILAQYLRQVIEQNNLSNKITVINKISHELILGIDIPERVDLIVTETFDCGLIGEGCLNNISHGKENFLKPNGIILPKKGELLATVVESSEIRNQLTISHDILGFDLSNFNTLRKQGEYLKLSNFNSYKELTSTTTIMKFDFNNKFPTVFHDKINMNIDNSGYIDCIIVWFKLYLTDNIILENAPTNNLHWNQWVLFPQTFCKANKGDILQINIDNNCGYLGISEWNILTKDNKTS